MSSHTGHRQRMRQRFLEYGLDNFADHNVLELLLFYAVPQKDTNGLAHDLLAAFDTLDGVFDADVESLMSVPGVKENTAALIRLVPALCRRYLMAKSEPGQLITDSEAAGEFLKPRFVGAKNETLYMVCMDAKMKVLDCRELSSGNTTSVHLDMRQAVRIALGQNASAVLLAHNHTGGFAIPSGEDVAATLRLREVLAEVGVTLTDHIVVAGDDFVSMADSGYLPAT